MRSDLGNKRGRLIAYSDRMEYCTLIKQAIQQGARQRYACQLVNISARTYQRWHKGSALIEDKRLLNKTPRSNKLSEETKDEILRVINEPEYRTLTPHQIVPKLLDANRYIASESTFYRVMKAHKQLKHRLKSTSVKRHKPRPLQATKSNQIYTWDITYLLSPIKGQYWYLYLVMDIYSRKIVGWQVHDCESSAHAADLIQDIVRREKVERNQLVIHSDNGSPMKGSTLRAKLIDLAISSSYSRPRVSNDNPYSESLFKTLKYHYSYPNDPFNTLLDARNWVGGFVNLYNHDHQHSSINFVTPNQRHEGIDETILMRRTEVLERAKAECPERWNGRNTRNLTHCKVVYLNPCKQQSISELDLISMQPAA